MMDIKDIKADFQIIGYRIKNLNIFNDFTYIELEDDELQRQIDVQYELGDIFDFDEESNAGLIDIFVDLNLSKEDATACINLGLEGCFSLSKECNTEQFTEMLEINGTASLYSIARGIISSVSSQMCVNGTVLIPMINTFEMRKKE